MIKQANVAAFGNIIKDKMKIVGGVAGKAFAPIFIGMEAMGAAQKSVAPIHDIGPARNFKPWSR